MTSFRPEWWPTCFEEAEPMRVVMSMGCVWVVCGMRVRVVL